MSDFTLLVNNILSLSVLGLNIFFVFIILAFFWKQNPLANKLLLFIKRYSYKIIFFLSAGGVLASLVYSNIIGFEPCVLCWYQRIFLFPIAILTLIALIKKEKVLNHYLLGLAIPGLLIGFYQYGVTMLGVPSLTPCTSSGGGCSVTYFVNFGYITIPFMAVSSFALIILVILVDKLFSDK